MNRARLAAPLLAGVILCGCDTGLAPPTDVSGFSGVIYFKNWPSADQVQELRIIAFNTYPSDSAIILQDVATGLAAIYPQIGQRNLLLDTTQQVLFADSIRYAFTTLGTTLQVGQYPYVALAWRYGPNVFSDWRPAGVYSLGPGPFDAAPVRVLLHRITPNINIIADFSNPPPRPWR
ncbi:MAG TPA: hypothetical protein VL126_14925 [Bacteroidota bacterium]|nr:hypothetical protein [Bacteroidota bacterium]